MLHRSARAYALLLVLGATSVLALCTGAFVTLNQANFASLNGSQRQREALLAAHSAIQFCWYQLEHNQRWGKSNFSENGPVAPSGGGLEARYVSGTRTITGNLTVPGNPGFTVEIENNLELAGSPSSGGLPGLPADSVRLTVVGRSGSFQSRCQALYRGEPMYDASLTAAGDLDLLSAYRVRMESDDKMRNWIRSNGNVDLGRIFATGADRHTVDIHQEDGGAKGVIWAKGDIRVTKEVGGATEQVALNAEELIEAQGLTNGTLAPKSRLNNEIYPLELSDLKFPTGSKGKLDPGLYVISNEVFTSGDTVKVLRHYREQPLIEPITGRRIWQTVYCDLETAVAQGTGLPGGYWEPGVEIKWVGGHKAPLGTGSSPEGSAMTYDFASNTFDTKGNSQIDVEGNFQVMSERSTSTAVMKLGTDEPTIVNATKELTLQGKVTGKGGLTTPGNVTLLAETDVATTEGNGVVLYGNNVTVCGGNTTAVDFKGLVYAKNQFSVWGGLGTEIVGSGEDSRLVTRRLDNRPLDYFNLTGAAVAQGGAIKIADTVNVKLRYDEKLLKDFTRGLPDNRRRLRLTAIREL